MRSASLPLASGLVLVVALALAGCAPAAPAPPSAATTEPTPEPAAEAVLLTDGEMEASCFGFISDFQNSQDATVTEISRDDLIDDTVFDIWDASGAQSFCFFQYSPDGPSSVALWQYGLIIGSSDDQAQHAEYEAAGWDPNVPSFTAADGTVLHGGWDGSYGDFLPARLDARTTSVWASGYYIDK